MRKKIKFLIIGIALLVITICICIWKQSDANGNSANMGLVCQKDGVVYYNKYEKGIFALKNGQETQLTSETAYSLNIFENKIYYITVADFSNIIIKSVDINGENGKAIATIYTSISKIYVTQNAIYYATNETGKGIAKIDLTGENEQIILPENVQDFQIAQNQIYYVNNANRICKIDISGKQNKELSDTAVARKIQVIDGWIYYYDQNENALFRLKKNGKKKELISVLIHNEMYNISGQYVYYFDKEQSKIARMKIGKSNQCNDIVSLNVSKTKINLVEDEIYYLDKSEDPSQTYQMHRRKISGEESQDIQY